MNTNWDDMARASLVLATGVLLIALLFARTQTIDNMRTDHCELLGGDRALRYDGKLTPAPVAEKDDELYHFNDSCRLVGVPAPAPIPTPEGWGGIGTPWPVATLEAAALRAGRYHHPQSPAADGDPTPTPVPPLPFSTTRYLAMVEVPTEPALVAFDGLGNSRQVQPVDTLAFFDQERGGLIARSSGFVWSFFLAGFALAVLCLFFMELRGAPWDRRE